MLTGSAAARRARALSAAILVSVLVAPGAVEGFAPAPALRASSRGAAAASLLSARDTGRLSSPRRALLRTGVARLAAQTDMAQQQQSDSEVLKGLSVRSVSSDVARPIVQGTGRQLVILLTHWGDLSSWEYAQQLRHALPALKEKGVEVVAVGIGGRESGKLFAQLVDFPEELLYYDEAGACCGALDCSPGYGRESALQAQDNAVSPYLRLLPMLLGIGSPGTLAKVIYGYFGDRSWNPEWIREQLALTAKGRGDFPYVEPATFDKVGSGYLRPFELATVRLQNMIGILNNWFDLIPTNADLVVQQGATLVLENGQTLYKFKDKGILVYGGERGVRSIQEVVDAALA